MERVSKTDGRRARKTAIWPVGRWERRADGVREVTLPLLVPIDAPILREFAQPIRPFISLYHKRVGKSGARETTALFGLFQSRRDGRNKKVRILGGLIGWDRREEGRYLRLLWALRFRIGGPR